MSVRVAIAVAMLLAACQAAPAPGASCTRSSDCSTPLVCAIGRCRAGCSDSRDCPTLARCLVEPSSGTRVCSLPATDDCAAHDCPLGFVCRGGQCINACGSIVACPDGVCDADACITVRTGPNDAGAGDASASTTWTIAIAQDADDGELGTDSVLADGEANDLVFAGFWAGADTRAFVRFALPGDLPAGAHIVDAHLVVNASGTDGLVSDTEHLMVQLDDSADAPAVTLVSDYAGGATGAPPTSATVIWGPLTDWTLGVASSPDLSPLLQELVDRHAGLMAGAHVRFWITAGDYVSDGEVSWQDTVAAAGGPMLVITWTSP